MTESDSARDGVDPGPALDAAVARALGWIEDTLGWRPPSEVVRPTALAICAQHPPEYSTAWYLVGEVLQWLTAHTPEANEIVVTWNAWRAQWEVEVEVNLGFIRAGQPWLATGAPAYWTADTLPLALCHAVINIAAHASAE